MRAFIAAAGAKAAIGEVINIGSGFEISIGDVLKVVAGVLGVDAKPSAEAERIRPQASEVGRLRADNAKAARLIGWKPEYGGLDGLRRGIERTVAVVSRPAAAGRRRRATPCSSEALSWHGRNSWHSYRSSPRSHC